MAFVIDNNPAFDHFVNLDGESNYDSSYHVEGLFPDPYQSQVYSCGSVLSTDRGPTPPDDLHFNSANGLMMGTIWPDTSPIHEGSLSHQLKSEVFSNTSNNQLQYSQHTPPLFGASLHDIEAVRDGQATLTSETVEAVPVTADDIKNEEVVDEAPGKKARKTREKQSPATKISAELNRRNKFLERNRVAASKCREKKKEWASGLDGRARDMQRNRDALTSLSNSLREEVLYLKGEILRHSGCECPQIKAYLQKEVGKLAGSGSECSHCKHGSCSSTPKTTTSPKSFDESSNYTHSIEDNSQGTPSMWTS